MQEILQAAAPGTDVLAFDTTLTSHNTTISVLHSVNLLGIVREIGHAELTQEVLREATL